MPGEVTTEAPMTSEDPDVRNFLGQPSVRQVISDISAEAAARRICSGFQVYHRQGSGTAAAGYH